MFPVYKQGWTHDESLVGAKLKNLEKISENLKKLTEKLKIWKCSEDDQPGWSSSRSAHIYNLKYNDPPHNAQKQERAHRKKKQIIPILHNKIEVKHVKGDTNQGIVSIDNKFQNMNKHIVSW